MRKTGFVLLVAGLLGFFFCHTKLADLEPVPPGVEIGDYTEYEAGKLELARYGAAIVGLIGILMTLFPSGR
jgi:hypothetical protein